ncbi:stage II sporulation protein M [Candidatus Woesearchaeota archaeon]|nr:stage II sporulation protein M [Candidatus Woesearchaeota archaeon]
MVFEQFLELKNLKRHLLFVFLLGFTYAIFGFAVARLFFSSSVSIVILFTTTLLLVPAVTKIIDREEEIESKEGLRHFFRNHSTIIEVYVILFLGIFLAFFVIGFFGQLDDSFSYQLNFLEQAEQLSTETISEFGVSEYNPTFSNFLGLISYNLFIAIICFVLSLFYGAGALFLVTLNASVFATFIVYVIRNVSKAALVFGLFLIHLIPEMAGFLVAAIAGGVVSRAIMHERFRSKGFRNVMKDALVLFLIAVGFIIIAALLEMFVTSKIVHGLI